MFSDNELHLLHRGLRTMQQEEEASVLNPGMDRHDWEDFLKEVEAVRQKVAALMSAA